jgi:hypothetical protein
LRHFLVKLLLDVVFAHKKPDAAAAFLSRGGLGCSMLDDYKGNSHADWSWWFRA